MKKRPSLWMFAAGTFAVIAILAYLFFALTLADHMEPYSAPAPEDKAAPTKPAM
ncbi:MAG: hypothetical protein ABI684_15440 [Nitrospirota bacterium]